MRTDKLPLPRSRTVIMALHAHTALEVFRDGRATLAEWTSVADALNLVNAFGRLGRKLLNRPPSLADAFIGLRDAHLQQGLVRLDDSVLPALADVVGAYDIGLRTLARRTVWDALGVVDECVAERAAASDVNEWHADGIHPPMLTEPESVPSQLSER